MRTQNLDNIMVSISVLKAMAGDLVKAGFTRVYRTKEDQAKLTALYAQTAAEKTPSLDVTRLGRTDAAGNQQVDGGYLIFTAEGQKMVTPTSLVADLTKFGFRLAVVETFEREGDDRNIRLRMTWSRNSQANCLLGERQKAIARKYCDLVYHKLFGFNNPESVGLEGDESPIRGSIVTLNFSGVVDSRQLSQNQGLVRLVRMTDENGHLACPLRNPGGKTPERCPEKTPERFEASPGQAFDDGLRERRP